ncbi:MAG: hypothetical protein KAX18_06810 [Candidatus Lokiarchaeota archaeon]|nr:hypothetical protein [Candidatus Lokiarchaeota archaeon]
MPRAIILYEIDQSFGPNILADYYLKQDDKIPTTVLKEFSEKHVKKGYSDVTIRNDENRFYSNKVNAESINKENLYLCFILQEGEDLISLKSLFENIEAKVIQDYSPDKNKMVEILKNGLNSILSLVQKLQEPKIIKDILNERTKKMLDENLLQEARELIDLGEDVPEKLADEVKVAEELLKNKEYRKAKKSFSKASELAVLIQEEEIASFLQNKGDHVGMIPDLLKERESLNKEIEKIASELENNKLYLYDLLIDPIDRLIEISNNLEEEELTGELMKFKNNAQRATRLTNDLKGLDNKIKENLNKI